VATILPAAKPAAKTELCGADIVIESLIRHGVADVRPSGRGEHAAAPIAGEIQDRSARFCRATGKGAVSRLRATRSTSKISVCMATSGPGHDCHRDRRRKLDSIPLIVGQVKTR
jgi:hypothetical protein